MNKMTPRERIEASIASEPTDRMPFMPYLREFAMKQNGLTFADVYKDPDKYVEAQVNMHKKYDTDGVWDLYFMSPEAEAMGCEMLSPEDDPPSVASAPVKEKSDLSKIKICDPTKDGKLPMYIHIVKELRKAVGPDVPVFAFCQAGYRNAIMLRGINQFMTDLYYDPAFVHDLLEVATEGTIVYGKALIEAGADVIQIASPMASGHMVSRAHYEQFAFPNDKKQFAAYHEAGAKVFYHMCGWWNDRWDLILGTGADILSCDSPFVDVNIGDLKKVTQGIRCIFGNVDTAHTLMQGTPEEVRKETLESARMGYSDKTGYILGTSCTVCRDTPLENFEAYVEAANSIRYKQ